MATIHLTEIENGVNKEIHLCEECYKEEKQNIEADNTPSLDDVIKTLLKTMESAVEIGATCPVCGSTYRDFQEKGLFGCSNDYAVFKDGIEPLLEKIHGSTIHKGKVPQVSLKERPVVEKLFILRQELDDAVTNEMFEKAAELKKKIEGLEKQV
jgi:protein arginine kinase activator